MLVFLCARSTSSQQVPGYTARAWSASDGLQVKRINALAQTRDGYLWLGTDQGLLRFDGKSFTVMAAESLEFASVGEVSSLALDRDGALWVRMLDGRLGRYAGNHFAIQLSRSQGEAIVTAMTPSVSGGVLASGLVNGVVKVTATAMSRVPIRPRSLVLALDEDRDGSLWVGTRETGLLHWKDNALQSTFAGLPDSKVNTLKHDSRGDLWIGTDGGLSVWNGHILTRVLPEKADDPRVAVLALLETAAGDLWASTSQGLFRMHHGRLEHISIAQAGDEKVGTALFEDREGQVWYGAGSKLIQLRGTPVSTADTPGLPSGGFGPLYVDNQGRLWLAPLSGGLYWMKGSVVHHVAEAGLDSDVIYSISGNGSDVWLGRRNGGLTCLHMQADGTMQTSTWTTQQGLAQNSVYAVHAAADGTVWAGTLTRGVSRHSSGRMVNLSRETGFPMDAITAIATDRAGKVWVGTPDGLLTLNDTMPLHAEALPANIMLGEVTSLFADPDGSLWIGSTSGLSREQNGVVSFFTLPTALPARILGIGLAGDGRLWLSTPGVLAAIDKSELLSGKSPFASFRMYTTQSGLRSSEGVQRDATIAADPHSDSMWVATTNGLVRVTSGIREASQPAIMQITSVFADGSKLPVGSPTVIPAGSHRIVFNFIGLDLRAPEKVRLRYKLRHFDREWSTPSLNALAEYTNLPPGHYTFELLAANSDGVWSDMASMTQIVVEPLLWQRWPFRLAVAAFLLLLLVWIYRGRIHFLLSQADARFEERLAERGRISRELHDTLLQGVIGASMHLNLTAQSMPEDGRNRASLQTAIEVMEQVIDEARAAVMDLRTPNDCDLAVSLQNHVEKRLSDGSERYEMRISGTPRLLKPAIFDDVFRIAQEALMNAHLHAEAQRVTVTLNFEARRLRLSIEDNGIGIRQELLQNGRPGHLGLLSMRERARRVGGNFKILSQTGKGTSIELEIPSSVAFGQNKNPEFE